MNIISKPVNSLMKIVLGLTLLAWMALAGHTALSVLSPQAAAAAAATPSEATPEISVSSLNPLACLTPDEPFRTLVGRGLVEPRVQGRVLSISPSSAAPGNELTVPVELYAQGDEREIQFGLRFDAAALNLLDATLGADAEGAILTLDRAQAAAGVLGVSIKLIGEKTFTTGPNQVLDLNFRADGERERQTATIEFNDRPWRRTISGDGSTELLAGFNSGAVTIAAAIEGDVAPRPNGSEDGALTIGDWIQAGRFAARLDQLAAGAEFQRADTAPRATSGNGQITLADWVQVGRYTEGLDASQPAAGPTAPASFEEANALTVAALAGAGTSSAAQVRAVRAVSTTFTRGQDNSLIIELDALGGENAVSFTLNFNPAHISYVRSQLGTGVPALGEAVLNVNIAQLESGRVGIALALRGGRSFTAGTQQLLVVTFTVPTVGNQNTSGVTFGDDPVGRAVVNTNADAVNTEFTSATLNFTPTVNAIPVVTSISPSFVIVGGPALTLIVNGSDFVNGASVRVNGLERATRFVSSNELQAFLIPSDIAETGTIEISVINPPPAGGVSNSLTLAINNPQPSIIEVNPQVFGVNQQGTTITVVGSNFVSGATVQWNGQNRQTTFVNSTQLTAFIPQADFSQVGKQNVRVINPLPGGGASNVFQVTVRQSSALPRITQLTPETRIPGDVGFELKVTGTNFAEDSFVRWNGSPRQTTFISPTELRAQIPASDIAAPGEAAVSVISPPPGGGNSNILIFRIEGQANPAPQVTSISPSNVATGGASFILTVNGSGFISTSTVLFNGQPRQTSFVSSTELRATILATDIVSPSGALISVMTPPPGGGTSSSLPLTISLGAPVISFLSPNAASAGGGAFNLTVIGASFTQAAVVNWNGSPRPTTFVDGGELRASIPASDIATAGTAQVTVSVGGVTSNSLSFFIQSADNPLPRINSLNPSQALVGSPGFTLTVVGTGFYAGSIVRWNGSPRQTTFISPTELRAQILVTDVATANTAAVTVINSTPGGGSSNVVNFVTIPANQNPPVITTITPSTVNSGGPAFTIAVEGQNFTPTSVVQIGSDSRPTTFISPTQLTAQVTADDIAFGGSVTVNVFNPPPAGGGTSNVVMLTILNGIPTITSLEPAAIAAGAGVGNTTVAIIGTNFAPGAVVQVNGQNRPTTFISTTRLNVTILQSDRINPTDLTITATNPVPGGGTSNSQVLKVVPTNPLPRISSITPDSATFGSPGFTLVVNGTNFAPNAVVRFGNRDLPTEILSSTTATATVSAADLLLGGLVPVRVFNPQPGGGLSGALFFAISSPAPQLTSVSPTQIVGTGQPVTITVNGSNFVGASVVRFNGVEKPTSFVNTTQLTAVLQPIDLVGITSATIEVFTPAPGGGTSGAITVGVTPGQAPTPIISSLAPGAVIVGSGAITLTVNGANFVPATTINVNGSPRTTTFVNSTQLTVVLPASDFTSVTTLVITAVTPAPGGGTSNPFNFGVISGPPPAPSIISLSPGSGSIGVPFTLTVNGANFVPTSTVRVNGSTRVTSFVSSTQLTAQITADDVAALGTLTITVFTPEPGGGTSNSQLLQIVSGPNPAPMITSLNPFVVTAGSGAFTLTVNGANFSAGTVVRWNGLNQPTTVVSSTQLQAQISADLVAAPGTAIVTVFSPGPGGGDSNAVGFLIDTANPPDCRTVCMRSAAYYVRNISRLPNGVVLIPGANANLPLTVQGNETLIRTTLQGGTSGAAQLNAQFLATQLSLLVAGSSSSAAALQSPSRCYDVTFTPVLLSNNAVITANTSLGDIFTQIRSAVSDGRTQDMPQLASILLLLNGTDPFSTCNRQ